MIITRYFQSISQGEGGLQAWRERILSIFLLTLLVFGTLLYVVNAVPLVRRGQYALIGFYTIAYLWVLALTVFRRIPYTVRALGVMLIAFLLAASTLMDYGLSGDGRIWMLFFVVFTAVLLGLRAGIVATLVAGATYAGVGYLMTQGSLPLPTIEEMTNTSDPIAWVATGILVLFLGLTTVLSLGTLLQFLESSRRSLRETLKSERTLSKELEEERDKLQERTRALERRVVQVRTAAEISRVVSAELDPQRLMQVVVDMIKDRFSLYYAGVFLLDESKRYATLAAGTGEPAERMIAEGHRLSVGGTSMVGWATAHREARIALDVGQEAIRFDNPHLPHTRSEMALPLLRGDEVLGALTAQSAEPEAFDEDDLTVLQGIADSLATALENARLFQQTETALEEISALSQQYLGEAWAEVMESESDLSYTFESERSADEEGTSALEVPLRLRGEQVIGNILLEAQRGEWSPDEMEFIEAISNQAALALESARLLEETQRRAERERTLSELTTRFARSLDIDTLMQTVVRELGKLPKVREVSIHISPPDDGSPQGEDGETPQPEGKN